MPAFTVSFPSTRFARSAPALTLGLPLDSRSLPLGGLRRKAQKNHYIRASLGAGLQRDPALERRHHSRRGDEVRFHRGSELSLILLSEVCGAPGAGDLRVEHHASLPLWQFERLSVDRHIREEAIDDRLTGSLDAQPHGIGAD